MHIAKHGSGRRELVIAMLAALTLAGCSTMKNQGQASSIHTPPAGQPAQHNAGENSLTRAAAHARSRHMSSNHHMTASHETASRTEDATTGNAAAVLSRIHQANLIEIALGKFAKDKASAPEVRAYADQLIQDHANVDGTVVAMAQKKGTHLFGQTASP
jgi:predicted outer membrane protein